MCIVLWDKGSICEPVPSSPFPFPLSPSVLTPSPPSLPPHPHQMYPMAVVATAARGLVVYTLEGTPSEFRVRIVDTRYCLGSHDLAWGHMILCVLFNRKLTVHSSTSTAVSASSRTNRTSQRGLLWGPLRGVSPSITSTHKTRESSPTGVVYQKHCDSEQSCCWPPSRKVNVIR